MLSSDPARIPGDWYAADATPCWATIKTRKHGTNIRRDGWLHTGDMAVINPEGDVYIKGRCKNMLLSASGQNIYPEEIESRLNNLPYVKRITGHHVQ